MNIWQRSGLIITIVAFCFCLVASPVSAAVIERPDAGTIIGGLKDRPPMPEKPGPGIEVGGQQQNATPVPEGPSVKVSGIRITGQEIYSEDKLLSLISDAVGKELSLNELENLAVRIAKYFRSQGFLVASAFIPAQDIQDGQVEIRVVIGRYNKIDICNRSSLRQDVAASLLTGLRSGDYIRQDKLDRVLLLLNDTSGVSTKATLAPGEAPGTSDLIVEISDTARTSGAFFADNWGNRFTGQVRKGLSFDLNNLSGRGDTATVRGFYTGLGLNDTDFLYLLPTGGQGAKLGVGYSRMRYSLGDDFAALNANGLAETASIYESFVFIRSREFNLNGRIGFDSKRLRDRIDAVWSDSRKRADVWTVGLRGDNRDNIGGGGFTSFDLSRARGRLTLQSDEAQVNDTLPQTAGAYNKTNLNLSREQHITNRLTLNLFFAGQMTNKNLDTAEKISAGGASGVRAYPTGEANGDEGYIFTGELHWKLPTARLQAVFFYDNAKVILNKTPWDASVNKRILAGAGLGLIWNRVNDYAIRLDCAWKITEDPATADNDRNTRLWLVALKYF